MDSFSLHIELGNEAMQSGIDIANVLEEVSNRLILLGPVVDPHDGPICDENGNTIGRWEIR